MSAALPTPREYPATPAHLNAGCDDLFVQVLDASILVDGFTTEWLALRQRAAVRSGDETLARVINAGLAAAERAGILAWSQWLIRAFNQPSTKWGRNGVAIEVQA